MGKEFWKLSANFRFSLGMLFHIIYIELVFSICYDFVLSTSLHLWVVCVCSPVCMRARIIMSVCACPPDCLPAIPLLACLLFVSLSLSVSLSLFASLSTSLSVYPSIWLMVSGWVLVFRDCQSGYSLLAWLLLADFESDASTQGQEVSSAAGADACGDYWAKQGGSWTHSSWQRHLHAVFQPPSPLLFLVLIQGTPTILALELAEVCGGCCHRGSGKAENSKDVCKLSGQVDKSCWNLPFWDHISWHRKCTLQKGVSPLWCVLGILFETDSTSRPARTAGELLTRAGLVNSSRSVTWYVQVGGERACLLALSCQSLERNL